MGKGARNRSIRRYATNNRDKFNSLPNNLHENHRGTVRHISAKSFARRIRCVGWFING